MGSELSCCVRDQGVKGARKTVLAPSNSPVEPVKLGGGLGGMHTSVAPPPAASAEAKRSDGTAHINGTATVKTNGTSAHAASAGSSPVAASNSLASLRFSTEEAAEILKGVKTSLLRARDAEVEDKRIRNQQLNGRYGFDPYVAAQLAADDRIKHTRALRPPPPKPTTAAGRKAEAEAAGKKADWRAAVIPVGDIAEGMELKGELQDGAHFCDIRVTRVVKAPLASLPSEITATHKTDDIESSTEVVFVEFALLQAVSSAPLS